MAKKEKEHEEEVEVNSNQKKETFVTRWFKDYAVNNARELAIICDLTARSAQEQFKLFLNNKGNVEVFGVVFYATFVTILEFIRSKQRTWNQYSIEICKSVNIGYTNNDNEHNEKIGNFMPIMEYIGVNMNIVDDRPSSLDTISTNSIRWKELNSKKNIEGYNEIQEKAFKRLKDEYKVNMRTSELIIPLFCIFMDNITNVLKMKFREAEGTDVSEVSMNVFGLFDVFYSFNEEENQEIIEFQPNIFMKLALKSDENASKE